MAETNSVSIDTSKDVAQPTLEQEAARIDAELAKQGTAPAPAPTGDRPEWLPEKFKSAEDMAKAYGELEKKLGQPKTEETPATPAEGEAKTEDEKTAPDNAAVEAAAREAVKKSGLDLNDLSRKFWDKGSLDDADFTALEKAGYPKAMVTQFMEGQMALTNARAATVYDSVGGKESYTQMLEWAKGNLNAQDKAAFNQIVQSNNTGQINMAVAGLKAKYDAAVGVEPSNTVQGQTSVKSNGGIYRSVAELEKDMSDSRYWNDSAYRQDVISKLSRSNIM